jgi:hypothetical protein
MRNSIKNLFFAARFQEQSLIDKCLWFLLAAFTLLVFFYASTILMSIIYPVDSALLTF